ncbi:MAG: prepilin peptidase [Rickettsiales bacterium]|nr:prepilin peptidase [Rickettsiales bacterium]
MTMLDIFTFALLIVFGLGFGSFATMAIYRIPNNIPWISKKPFCPKCNHELYFRDYFSIISFIFYSGKCRFCKEKIEYHLAYFMTEILILVYFIINYLINNYSDLFIVNAGIIIAITIWSVIYANSKQNIDSILKVCLAFIAIKEIYLGLSITDLIFKIVTVIIFVMVNWHIIYTCLGKAKKSFNYLQFSSKNRFEDENLLIVKLCILTLISIPFSLNLIGLLYLSYLIVFIFIKNIFLRNACLAQLIILSNFVV